MPSKRYLRNHVEDEVTRLKYKTFSVHRRDDIVLNRRDRFTFGHDLKKCRRRGDETPIKLKPPIERTTEKVRPVPSQYPPATFPVSR